MSEETHQPSALTVPERLAADHEIDQFDCGIPSLNHWLQRRARRNETEGASRTYVVCSDYKVVGYYCLAAGSVLCADIPGRVRRNMPDPVPVVIIGRLAVDRDWQGHSLGPALLRDALSRTLGAAEVVGIRAVLVHSISEKARCFYQRYGFMESPSNPMTLIMTMKDITAALGV